MARTLLMGAEEALPTNTGTATSFSQASAVRLVNNSATASLVTVVETQSGNVVGSMTLPGNAVEIIEKQYTHCVFAANTSVRGAKVGFTA
jgi:hypothetical protein